MTVLYRAVGALLLSVVVAGTVATVPAGAEVANGPQIDVKSMHFMGEPAEPTFTAVQPDAATFTYRLDEGPERTVPVGDGGSTTVRFDLPPTDPTSHTVYVFSTTEAGGRSATSSAWLWVNRGTPSVEVLTEELVLGSPVELSVASEQPGIAAYTFWVDSGTRTTVPADSDGTAHATWIATAGGYPELRVFGTTVEGYETSPGYEQLVVNNGRPWVSSTEYPEFQVAGRPGMPGTFHFTSAMADVVEYRYVPLDGGEEQTVAAGPDGTADVTLTPSHSGLQTLLVLAVNCDGLVSGEGDYTIDVGQPHGSGSWPLRGV